MYALSAYIICDATLDEFPILHDSAFESYRVVSLLYCTRQKKRKKDKRREKPVVLENSREIVLQSP